ncbi:helix-turn-helix domain-containing protein, partial [Mycobacterium colombiense]|uniref:helix-turn-helix domain-containing protein n=1 Tax=Mycobacterium colombiense TaxID=339268 RepID=UPI001EE67F26
HDYTPHRSRSIPRFLRVISTDVGASLIAMRKKLGIKPSEIAELLGISTQEYNDIEANKKELKTDSSFRYTYLFTGQHHLDSSMITLKSKKALV